VLQETPARMEARASGGAKMHQNRRDKNAWFF
jgi:hypothetical protein